MPDKALARNKPEEIMNKKSVSFHHIHKSKSRYYYLHVEMKHVTQTLISNIG